MKHCEDSSEAKTAYGETLPVAIKYSFKWKEYETIEEVNAANDQLTDEEVIKVRNTERKNNARQKALQAAQDAAGIIKPTAENNEQVRLKDMLKTLLTAKMPDGSKRYTEEQAREIASTTLGIAWA